MPAKRLRSALAVVAVTAVVSPGCTHHADVKPPAAAAPPPMSQQASMAEQIRQKQAEFRMQHGGYPPGPQRAR